MSNEADIIQWEKRITKLLDRIGRDIWKLTDLEGSPKLDGLRREFKGARNFFDSYYLDIAKHEEITA